MRLSNSFSKFACPIAMLLGIQVSAQSIDFKMGGKGLDTLTYGSKLVGNGMFLPSSVSFKNSQVSLTGASYTADLAKNIITYTIANKCIIQCHYVKVSDTRLDFKFVAKNLSADTLTSVKGQFAKTVADTIPQYVQTNCIGNSCRDGNPYGGPNGNGVFIPLNDFPSWGTGGEDNRLGHGPQIAFFGMGSCNIAVCNMSDPEQSHSWWAKPYGSRSINFTFTLSEHVAPNGYSDTCNISFRFDAPGKVTVSRLTTLCSDAVMRYGGAFPSIAPNWPDRRAIGACMASDPYDPSNTTLKNPNRYYNNSQDFDIRTPAGLEKFRTLMLDDRAAKCVSGLRKVNGQGVIEWDIEGFGYLEGCGGVSSDFPGEPHMALTLAPELGYISPNSKDGLCIVDEYFKKFRDAGFIPGVCIDAQKIVRNAKGDGWEVKDVADHGKEILEDIRYAHERWGCRLFYVDANIYNEYDGIPGNEYAIDGKELLSQALAEFDDVLILGEHQTYDYYRYAGAVFEEARSFCPYGINSTAEGVRMVYPNAFSVIAVYPVPNPNVTGGTCGQLPITPWISGSRKGDIYLSHIWYDGLVDGVQILDSLKKINDINGVRPYNIKITSPATGSTLGKTFSITATATDSGTNAGIDSVEFLSSGVKLGVAKTAPYSFTWTNALPGKHSLYARAIDKNKNQVCSQPVNVVVDATAIRTIDGLMLKNSVQGPISVSVYSLNGRLIRKMDSKDPTRLLTPVVLRGLSSGIYIMKIKHANGAIDKRKMEVVW